MTPLDDNDGMPTIEDVQEMLMNEPSTPIGPDPITAEEAGGSTEDSQVQGGGEEKPPVEPTPTPAKPEVEEPVKPEEGETDSGDGVAEPPPAPTPPPQAASEADELRAKLELIEQSNKEMREFIQAQKAQPPAPAQPGAPRARVFNLDVPPKLADDLGAEDPGTRTSALKFLVNAIAEETYHKAVSDMQAYVEKYVPAQVQAVNQLTQEQENTRRDFYTTYPELDKPGLHATVMQVAEMVMSEYNTTRWSTPLRNEIGRRVKAIVAGVAVPAATPSPTPSTTGAVSAPKRQVARVGAAQGARPAAGKPNSGGFAEQAATLLGVDL